MECNLESNAQYFRSFSLFWVFLPWLLPVFLHLTPRCGWVRNHFGDWVAGVLTCTHLYMLLTHTSTIGFCHVIKKNYCFCTEEQLSKNTQIKYDSEAVSRLLLIFHQRTGAIVCLNWFCHAIWRLIHNATIFQTLGCKTLRFKQQCTYYHYPPSIRLSFPSIHPTLMWKHNHLLIALGLKWVPLHSLKH